MTTTTDTPSSGVPGGSGVDLARVALRNARAAAKTKPQPKRRTGASASGRPRTGRDPQPFAAALTQMMADRGWEQAAAGGSVLDQWPTIAPELTGKVTAVRFDAETRTLHLLPCTPAYRTQLTLHQRQLITKINTVAGDGTVRHLEILRPNSTRPEPRTAGPSPAPAAAPAVEDRPVRTRETASDGYRAALAAHHTHRQSPVPAVDPAVQAARDQQIRNRLREPEEEFGDGQAEDRPVEQAIAVPIGPTGLPGSGPVGEESRSSLHDRACGRLRRPNTPPSTRGSSDPQPLVGR